MEDPARFDAELATPLPGRARKASPSDTRQATNDLMAFGAWARSMQGG